MLQRSLIVRFAVPVIALGVLVMSCASPQLRAAESDVVASAAGVRRTPAPARSVKTQPRKTAVKPKPIAPAASTAKAPAPAFPEDTQRREIDSADAWGQVSASAVNVRTGPGTEHGVVVTLKTAEYVRARASQGGWLEIDWPRNAALWVPRETVTLSEVNGKQVATAKAALPLRMQGIRTATSVTRLNAGESVTVLSEVNGWYRVEAPASAKAYISAKYVVLGVQPPLNAVVVKSPEAEKLLATVPSAKDAPAASTAVPPIAEKPSEAAKVAALAEPAPTAAVPVAETPTMAVAAKPLIEDSAAPAPVAEPEPKRETPEDIKREFVATIEDTRRRLTEAPAHTLTDEPATPAVPEPASAPLVPDEDRAPSTATESLTKDFELRQIESEKKKLLDEHAELEAQQKRLLDESRRLEEETKQKAAKVAEELETARREAEAKQKAEAEETARKLAAAQREQEIETARRETEAQQKAEAEETARKLVAAQRDQEIETARREAEVKQKAEEESKRKNAEPVGSFMEPEPAAPAPSTAPVIDTSTPSRVESTVLAALPEPRTSHSAAQKAPAKKHEDAPAKAIVFDDEPSAPVDETRLDFTPEAVKNVRSKFIIPNHEPRKPGTRAEIVDMAETVSLPDEESSRAAVIEEAPAIPVAPKKPSKPLIEESALPVPVGEAPAAYRLKPNATLVHSVDEASGRVANDMGTLQRADWSPVAGATYALVQNGRVIHYLTARDEMDLSAFLGRNVQVTGTPVLGATSEHSVLEVSSITARE